KIAGLVQRLQDGESIVISEGYAWELERRGYLAAGGFVPEVVLDHPEVVRALHEEYVHAGSDVVQAFTVRHCEITTYFAHRTKLRSVDREKDLENLNRTALRIARDVANKTGTLMAGGVCNTGVYDPDDPKSIEMEQVEWAVEEGADYIIGETFNDYGEGLLALQAIQKHGKGLPAVITLSPFIPDVTTDDIPMAEACRKLEEAGAAVVGLNCSRGPETMLPLLKEIRKVCKGPIAALPVTFRCREDCKTFRSFKDPYSDPDKRVKSWNRSIFMSNPKDIRKFAEEAKAIGVQYIGLCCGNYSSFLREVAEVYGRKPPASKFSPNEAIHVLFGDNVNNRAKKILQYSAGTV
ncbi:hypothetical protein FSP39_013204, partial [Pinctada imbricata]